MNASSNRRGAGKYSSRVTVEKPTLTTAADGQRITTWTTHATLWAAIEHGNAGESHENNRNQPFAEVKLRVRSSVTSRSITTDMRLVLPGNVTCGIGGVRDVDEARIEVEILAQRIKR